MIFILYTFFARVSAALVRRWRRLRNFCCEEWSEWIKTIKTKKKKQKKNWVRVQIDRYKSSAKINGTFSSSAWSLVFAIMWTVFSVNWLFIVSHWFLIYIRRFRSRKCMRSPLPACCLVDAAIPNYFSASRVLNEIRPKVNEFLTLFYRYDRLIVHVKLQWTLNVIGIGRHSENTVNFFTLTGRKLSTKIPSEFNLSKQKKELYFVFGAIRAER